MLGVRREEKIRVENEFREGRLDLVCCTPTLAMGINMPCDIVVISSVRRWNPLTSDSEILPSSELIQMMGKSWTTRPTRSTGVWKSGNFVLFEGLF